MGDSSAAEHSSHWRVFNTHRSPRRPRFDADHHFHSVAGAYRISNPYVSLTKAEVVERVWRAMPGAVPVTSSCWRNARLPEGVTHCGECVPCMIRRVAIETHGDDPTPYARDSFAQNFSTMEADDEARRNLADLCEFSRKFETMSDPDLIDEWPELYSPMLITLLPLICIVGQRSRRALCCRSIQDYPPR